MIFNKFKDKHIVLASSSPRRQELFKKLGIDFSIKIKEIEENYPLNLKEEEITNYLAILKAEAFEGEINKNEFVVTSDTIVWYKNSALEKPKNKKQAIEMLQKLSGTHHKVITSVCIKSTEVQKVFFDTTIVYFKQLTSDEISYYVEKYKPFDKAGAYGIQEWIGFIGVTKIEGSYFNVMGLPVHKLYEELLKI
ncbi:septum formation inhibitor Maf [Lutibacter profundi]|uniref:dTTP/UTP pyrophosphatase n=1 Tax=Lutibacter profundi TaxID=1622118 RepID=A0A0X8G4T4_9FLAO|nr:Maf family nucleotide pyrophosphatase [Lutibacter profundi]AMC10063.1 septum formation inhibitor Maf [Lutibacter profundi]